MDHQCCVSTSHLFLFDSNYFIFETKKCKKFIYSERYEFVFNWPKFWNDSQICSSFKHNFCNIVLLFRNANTIVLRSCFLIFAILGWKILNFEILLSSSFLQSWYQYHYFENNTCSDNFPFGNGDLYLWFWRHFHEGFLSLIQK